MTKDLQLMRKRMEITELGQTWYGKFRQAMGWIFSLYCVYRIVIVSCSHPIGPKASHNGAKIDSVVPHQPHLWNDLWERKPHQAIRSRIIDSRQARRCFRLEPRHRHLVQGGWSHPDW